MSNAPMKDAVIAARSRLRRGEAINPHPFAQLSPQKGGRPKLLCLDAWFWISLSKAHYGKNADAVGCLGTLRAAVERGEVVVAIDDANAFEGAKSSNAGRKERLCSFMMELSRNHFLLPDHVTRPLELSNAVSTLYLGLPPQDVRTAVLARGMGAHMGIPRPEAPRLPLEEQGIFEAPELSLFWLLHAEGLDWQEHNAIGQEGIEQIKGIRAMDAGMSIEQRRRAECSNMDGGHSGADLDRALERAGIDQGTFREWLRDGHAEEFWTAVPTQDVILSLMLVRDRNAQDVTVANDLLDWQFLRKAIPYADAVATEVRWADYARRAGLDAKYETSMISSVASLDEWLRELTAVA